MNQILAYSLRNRASSGIWRSFISRSYLKSLGSHSIYFRSFASRGKADDESPKKPKPKLEKKETRVDKESDHGVQKDTSESDALEQDTKASPSESDLKADELADQVDESAFASDLNAALVDANTSDLPALIVEQRLFKKEPPPEDLSTVLCLPVTRRPLIPGFYKTITVKDPKVCQALLAAMKKGSPYIGVFLSRNDESTKDSIDSLNEIYPVGSLASLINILPSTGSGSGGVTAIVYPHRRVQATGIVNEPGAASVSSVHIETLKDEPFNRKDSAIRAMTQEIFIVLTDIAKMNSFFREHISHHNVSSQIFESPALLADFIAVLCSTDPPDLQSVLSATNVETRLKAALTLLKKEYVNAQLQHSISKDVESKINARQREHYLHEQLKVIKKELGLETDSKDKILETFRSRAAALTMPEPVSKVFQEELSKLAILEPVGTEFNITRNYLDWLTQVPWGKTSQDQFEYEASARILNEDHYGLDDVKDRILEFIAVGKLRGTVQGKIICLVGPPGVGKTSIGKSIARAIGRRYFRFSVGGLSDVAEIKGHRRTYVGAMPGKLVQALKSTGASNPLILIDEVDKIGRSGHNGDPSSALLELLDPEQNNSFMDHYLDVPLDLSQVLFVCTANVTDTIPAPLLDRMEVIQLSGYIAQEKMEIARQYLVPTARKDCGLAEWHVRLDPLVIENLIRYYCRESGVRNLKKHIEKIFRKAALQLVKGNKLPRPITTIDATAVQDATSSSSPSVPACDRKEMSELVVSPSVSGECVSPSQSSTTTPVPSQEPLMTITNGNLSDYVGSPVFTSDRLYDVTPPGVVMGLAWTSMGGTVLYIETLLEKQSKSATHGSESSHRHKPGLIRTGQLGKVMEESSTIAYSVAKSFLIGLNVPESDFFDTAAIHLHVPEGATPKDGPSAGITMAASLLSLALNKPVRPALAMTGELSLTGKVLRIGGLKEKAIAAKRAGVTHILFPKSNEADWKILPSHITEGLEPHLIDSFEEVYDHCFRYDSK